jgi:hypothetical protein
MGWLSASMMRCPMTLGLVGRKVAVEHDQEFVPPQARDGIAVAHGAGQPLRDDAQHLVARLVALLIIDALEAVQIDEEQRDRAAVAPHALQRMRQLLLKRGTVVQTRECIVVRYVLLLARHLHPVRHILHQRHDGCDMALRIGQRRVEPFRMDFSATVAHKTGFNAVLSLPALVEGAARPGSDAHPSSAATRADSVRAATTPTPSP